MISILRPTIRGIDKKYSKKVLGQLDHREVRHR